MLKRKISGRSIGVFLLVLVTVVAVVVPIAVFAGDEEEISLVEEINLPEESEEVYYHEPVLPPVFARPSVPQTQTHQVDVGLYYGTTSRKELTLSAQQDSMLVYGGDVFKTLNASWADGVMYVDGIPCEKAVVRSENPIHLSASGWSYEGTIILTSGDRGITVVNRVDIDTYVKGVMSAEIGADGSYESRKAFSVICRTLVYVAKDHGEDFDLCNRNCCQSYRGTYHRDEINDKAVDETHGTVITYGGEPCLVSYSSSHGYYSCSSFAAWVGADIPYLRVVRYDNEPLDYGGEWEQAYTYEQLSKMLKGFTQTGYVKNISIKETDPYGGTYVYKLNVTDTAGNVSEITYGGTIMAYLGIRSANFTIEQTGDGVILHGIGNGHGVGYSQRGGHQMGLDGYSYSQILSFYFPGTQLAMCKDYH